MIIAHRFVVLPTLRSPPAWLRNCACGFVYWLAFLLVLEPDNVLRASRLGHPLVFDHEVLRIIAAALLGAPVTPVLLALTRRFPIAGANRLLHAVMHFGATVTLAFAMILASCFLVAWGFDREWLPSLADLHDELVSNWLLLVFALCALTAILHACHFFYRSAPSRPAIAASPYLTRVAVKTRGHQSFVDLASVDWIETQGNYLGLHVGSTVHLIRESSVIFEPQLDPNDFVRIHRRVIVAVDRIRDLRPATNGDATLRLLDGQELRVSRSYRKILAEKWGARAPDRTPDE